jgi:hypothetical protein
MDRTFGSSPKSSSPKSSSVRSRSSSNRRTSKSSSGTSSLSVEEDLKMPDMLPAKLNYSEKVAKKMRKLFQMRDKVAPFDSYYLLGNLFYVYLFKKYKMDCIMPHFIIDLQLDSIPASHDGVIERNVDKIFRCIKNGSEIIIIPLVFNVFIDAGNNTAHVNLLIYRQSTGNLEHFEPHGSHYDGNGQEFVTEQINAFIKKMVDELNFSIRYDNRGQPEHEKMKKITMTHSYDTCPDEEGLQVLEEASKMPRLIIEPEGYCMVWSMFFTELCLKNPERSSRDIYDAIMEKTELYSEKNDYLRNVIRGYTCFINNKIAKHFSHVFDETELTQKVNMLLNDMDLDQEGRDKLTSYGEKMVDIMEMETESRRGIRHPEAAERYARFAEKMRDARSSSSSSSSLHSRSHSRSHSPQRIKKTNRSSKRKASSSSKNATQKRDS